MGFNTVAFLLNDFGHELAKSPRTATWMLCHPPHHNDDHVRTHARVAAEHGEPRIHEQALEVLPTFHADQRKFFTAGGNCISELKVIRTRVDAKTKRRVVVLELPDYLQDRSRSRF